MKRLFCCVAALLISALSWAQDNKQEVKELNSSKIEYAPSISADGTVLLFQSNRSGKYELYEARLGSNDQWSKPSKLTGELNEYGTDRDLIGGPSISYDGNRIYFFASYDSGFGAEDIYYTDRTQNGWGPPINMGKVINSKNYEGFPNISSDGKSLYFMRLNKNLVNNLNCYTIMVSKKGPDGAWQTPEKLPAPVNLGCEKFPRIMPDNKTMIFSSIREGSIDNSFDLYETKINASGVWEEPKFLTFSNTPDHDYFSAVSSQFDKLYTNVKGPEGYDIYSYDIPPEFKPKSKIVNIQGVVSSSNGSPIGAQLLVIRKSDQKEVANLGNNISNGEYTLVLSEGSYSIKAQAKGYQPFEENIELNNIKKYRLIEKNIVLNPRQQKVNLSAINTRSGESLDVQFVITDTAQNVQRSNSSFMATYGMAYSILADKEGYETSALPFSMAHLDSSSVQLEIKLAPNRPEIKIMPRDAETKEPIAVSFMLRDLTRKKTLYKDKLTQDSVMTLDFNSKFRVYAMAKKYLFVKEIIDLSGQSGYERIDYPLELQPIKPGAKLTLKEIYFDFGSAELDKSSYDELAAVYNFLRRNKSLVVEISAHTDNVGSLSDNLELSQERARAVVNFLTEKGVPAVMLQGIGYGESQPIASNNSASGRAKNRRVEFKVLKIRGT